MRRTVTPPDSSAPGAGVSSGGYRCDPELDVGVSLNRSGGSARGPSDCQNAPHAPADRVLAVVPRKLALSTLAAATLLAGCGGSNSPTNTKAASKTTAAAPPPPALIERVGPVETGAAPSSSLTVSPGEPVDFQTYLSPRLGPRVQVKLSFSRGPGTRWTATATVGSRTSTATITSSTAKPITLVGLRYGCALPPSASFCPAQHVVTSATHDQAQFSAPPPQPIAIRAEVGPLSQAAFPAQSTGTPAPPYRPEEGVQAIAASSVTVSGAISKRTYARSATVKPGEIVVMETHLAGRLTGAPQPVTVSFSRGPSSTITVSASVPGGHMAQATIKGAHGAPIAIGPPTDYTCFLPPVPTFCPARSIHVSDHHYAIMFATTPRTPITIVGLAQAR